MSNEKNEWQERELGALWLGKSNSGTPFLSGEIAGEKVVLFKNKHKVEGDNKPYYHVYRSVDKNSGGGSSENTSKASQDDDIPF